MKADLKRRRHGFVCWPLLLAAAVMLTLKMNAIAEEAEQATDWLAARQFNPYLANVPEPGAAQPKPEFVPGQILVGFHPGGAGRAEEVRRGLGAKKIKEWSEIQAQHWKLPPGLSVERAVENLSRNPNVSFAEPNYLIHISGHPEPLPDDEYRNRLWGMHNLGQSGGTMRADVDALAAWGLAPGSAPVIVAVIDTGIDYTHPDLAEKVWRDEQGDVIGRDFVNEDDDPMDDHGHGTHVAGTIAAMGNNVLGVIGVAGLNPNIKLLPVKFLNQYGSGTTDAAVSSVLYAASFKDQAGNPLVRISNNSWGGGNKSKALENAIKGCGAVFCAAAGNSGSSSFHYPAAYKLANIVAVAATDHHDQLAPWSNFSSSWVHLAAPGVSIFSTLPNEGYRFASGTSMATPHVAGALALLLSQNPSWDNASLKTHLLANVDAKSSLSGKVTSGGRLNVANALNAPPILDVVAPDPINDLTVSLATQTSLTLSWTATGDDGGEGVAYLYDLRYSISPEADWNNAPAVAHLPNPQGAGATETVTVENLLAGATYYFGLWVVDAAGNASEFSNIANGGTEPLDWDVEMVDPDNETRQVGRYSSLAFDPLDGQPAVLYDDSRGQIHFATRAGEVWTTGLVGPAQGGVSLAFQPESPHNATASWVAPGKMGKGGRPTQTLIFGTRTGNSWSQTTVQANLQLGAEITSMAYGPTGPAISFDQYSGTRSLRFAWREGNTWKTQLVDDNCHPRYNSLAFAPNGNPAIAYSWDMDEDGYLDTVKYAEGVWNGQNYSWTISIAHTAPIGGVFVSLSFDSAGNPVITHRTDSLSFNQAEVILLQTSEQGWVSEIVAEGNLSFSTVDPLDQVHVAYQALGALHVGSAPLDISGDWSHSVADAPTSLFWPGSIRIAPDSKPAATYRTGGLRFSKRR